MDQTQARAPLHLWIVGILSLLWNLFGATDYALTRTKGAEWINQAMTGVDGKAYMDYIDAFPIWASFGWGLGVWCALGGSILLLMRNRLAAPVFALSLIGAILGIGYQLMNPVGIAALNEGFGAIVPYLIIVIAAGLYFYARAMSSKGVLR